MILENGAADEVLVLRDFDIKIDIAALIQHINNNPSEYQVCECESNRLLNLNRTDGIDHETIKKISESRLNQPILITAIDGYEWVIDGNHRLLRRLELGKKVTSYITVNGGQLDPFVSELSWH